MAALTPDGKALVTGRYEETVLWDLATGKALRSFPVEHGSAYAAALSPDGKTLVTAIRSLHVLSPEKRMFQWQRERFLRVWDLNSGRELRRLDTQTQAQPLAFAPDSTKLACLSAGGPSRGVYLWDVTTGRRLSKLSFEKPDAVGGYRFSFAPDGKLLASADQPAAGDWRSAIHLWDVATGREVRQFRAHLGRITAIAFSPDGTMLLSAGGDYSARLWEVFSGKLLAEIRGHQEEILAAAFSPDGRRIATASADTTVLIWDVAALKNEPVRHSARLTSEGLHALWVGLAGDHSIGDSSMYRLVAAPESAVPFLKERLSGELTVKQPVRQLIAELDSDSFKVREEATRELEKLGEAAAPALRRCLAENPSAEVRRRVERLLNSRKRNQAQHQHPSPEELRLSRALIVLAWIGTTEAHKVLAELAAGPAESSLTQEAKVWLERLAKRPAARP
jgi:Tol biopolymer transport system component